jgi:hypothetical protein
MCEHCKAALSELIKTREILRNLEKVEPPPWFTQKTMNRIREEAESKKSLFQRIFYPLHIKIPLEALTTCLVVVLALFVYKNTEPEIKAIHEPAETVTVSPQDQTQKQENKVTPVPKALEGKSDGMLKEDHELQRNPISSARPEGSSAGGLSQNKPFPAAIPELQMQDKSSQGAGSRYEAKTSETEVLKKQESIPAQKSVAAPAAKLKEDSIAPAVGSDAAKDTQEVTKARASRESQATSVAESKQIPFTVVTNNIETTAKETESLLNRFNAKNIKRSSRQPRLVIFDADLPGQKVKGFFDALKAVGDVKGKDIPLNPAQDYLAVHIEITGNP